MSIEDERKSYSPKNLSEIYSIDKIVMDAITLTVTHLDCESGFEKIEKSKILKWETKLGDHESQTPEELADCFAGVLNDYLNMDLEDNLPNIFKEFSFKVIQGVVGDEQVLTVTLSKKTDSQ